MFFSDKPQETSPPQQDSIYPPHDGMLSPLNSNVNNLNITPPFSFNYLIMMMTREVPSHQVDATRHYLPATVQYIPPPPGLGAYPPGLGPQDRGYAYANNGGLLSIPEHQNPASKNANPYVPYTHHFGNWAYNPYQQSNWYETLSTGVNHGIIIIILFLLGRSSGEQ